MGREGTLSSLPKGSCCVRREGNAGVMFGAWRSWLCAGGAATPMGDGSRTGCQPGCKLMPQCCSLLRDVVWPVLCSQLGRWSWCWETARIFWHSLVLWGSHFAACWGWYLHSDQCACVEAGALGMCQECRCYLAGGRDCRRQPVLSCPGDPAASSSARAPALKAPTLPSLAWLFALLKALQTGSESSPQVLLGSLPQNQPL